MADRFPSETSVYLTSQCCAYCGTLTLFPLRDGTCAASCVWEGLWLQQKWHRMRLCLKKGHPAFAWLSCDARSWNSTSSVRRSKQQHGCSSREAQLRSQLLASLSLQTHEWASVPIIMAPTIIKSPPFFEPSQLRSQTLWSRDKPFLLSPFWILIHSNCERYNKMLVGVVTIWDDLYTAVGRVRIC